MSDNGNMTMPKMNNQGRPLLPAQGQNIASFKTYLEAQKAVDTLSDAQFPVKLVTIVGSDLRMVERVTGRLNYPRVAGAGLISGAWFGLFVGIVLSFFSSQIESTSIVASLGIGAGFGLLFSVLSYALSRGKRDFTSASQIVATRYDILCETSKATEALQILREHQIVTAAPISTPSKPLETESGQPRYGVRIEQVTTAKATEAKVAEVKSPEAEEN